MSFSKTAHRLGIAQPTISAAIARLEAETGAELFDRRLRILTPAGKLYLKGAEEFLRLYEELQKELFLLKKRYRFDLRLGICSLALSENLTDPLLSFFQLHPKVNLSLHQNNDETLCRLIQEDQLDLALVQSTKPEIPGFLCYPLPEEEIQIYLLASEKTNVKSAFTDHVIHEEALHMLLSRPLLIPEEGHALRTMINSLYAKAGLSPKIRLECSCPHILARYLNAGVGTTILPASYHSVFPDTCILSFSNKYHLYWLLICKQNRPETIQLAAMLSQFLSKEGGLAWTQYN